MKTAPSVLSLVSVAFLVFFAPGCKDTDPKMNPSDKPLEGVTWKLWELSGNEISPAGEADPVTITFDPATGQVSGFSGVNRFHGSYTIDDSVISFGPVISTRMAGAPELMELESAFLKFVSTDVDFEITDGRLALAINETEIARFVPIDE